MRLTYLTAVPSSDGDDGAGDFALTVDGAVLSQEKRVAWGQVRVSPTPSSVFAGCKKSADPNNNPPAFGLKLAIARGFWSVTFSRTLDGSSVSGRCASWQSAFLGVPATFVFVPQVSGLCAQNVLGVVIGVNPLRQWSVSAWGRVTPDLRSVAANTR